MKKNCGLCDNEGKYKCPVCVIEYCSLNCFKQHKENQCNPHTKVIENSVQEDKTNLKENEFFTQDTVPAEKLQLLGHDKNVQALLQNRHLRDFLKEIDQSSNPEQIMQKAMMEPIFVEFVDACLLVVDNPKQ
ncbi:zinc finger HIT domain-containing protein 3 [Onthophagus taurus]|uniref:zinc finger HIT domain-containing protein 3 n=1 Tax=Onthophagus taurus TaxID=166361 RepID=UPI0039BDBEA2